MMPAVIAFDVYGTLIDTHGVVIWLQEFVVDKAEEISRVWRAKQLEYSFRCGLMCTCETFDVCSGWSLDYTCTYLDIGLATDQKAELMNRGHTVAVAVAVAVGWGVYLWRIL